MKHVFSTPTTEAAAKFLSRVPYRQRLMMGRMNWPSGWISTPARSLNEVYLGLQVESKRVPSLLVPELIAWVDEVVGDHELAQALRTCECGSHLDHCSELQEIIGVRLAQLRGIAGDEDILRQQA